jgi:hypothetical protein
LPVYNLLRWRKIVTLKLIQFAVERKEPPAPKKPPIKEPKGPKKPIGDPPPKKPAKRVALHCHRLANRTPADLNIDSLLVWLETFQQPKPHSDWQLAPLHAVDRNIRAS